MIAAIMERPNLDSDHHVSSLESEEIVFLVDEVVQVVERTNAKGTEYAMLPYSLELLERPIPIENRIQHLIPYIEPTANLLSADAIAKEIEAERHQVEGIARQIGIATINVENSDGQPRFLYPVYTKELLGEELAWVRAYDELEDWVSVGEIEDFLARDARWIIWRANELGIFRQEKGVISGRRAMAYPKTLIPKLRHIILVVPKIDNRFTVHQLASYHNQSWDWVKNRLAEAGLEPELTDDQRYGAFLETYAEESDEIIRQAVIERPPPAGSWVTASAIAIALNKSFRWVDARIDKSMARDMQDDTGKTEKHYRDTELERLRGILDEIRTYPVVVDQLAVKAIAKNIGRSQRWVSARLPMTDFAQTAMRDSRDQIRMYYDKEVTAALEALPETVVAPVRKNTPQSAESIVAIIAGKIPVGVVLTGEMARKLKVEDADVPSLTTIQKYFGSIRTLNEAIVQSRRN